MADYRATSTEFTAVADAIRTKGGTSAQLTWPNGFVSAVQAIPTGAGVVQPLSVTQNGTYNPPSGVDGYAPVTVSVSGGGGDDVFQLWADFNSQGLSENGWISSDGLHSLQHVSGDWQVNNGQLVLDGVNYIYLPLPSFNSAIEITCTIDPTSNPSSPSSNWYANSAILGWDIGGNQNDFALTYTKSNNACAAGIGYKNNNHSRGSINTALGEEHVYKIVLVGNASAVLYVDGVKSTYASNSTDYSSTVTKLGIFRLVNAPSSATPLKGLVRRIRVWNCDVG